MSCNITEAFINLREGLNKNIRKIGGLSSKHFEEKIKILIHGIFISLRGLHFWVHAYKIDEF